MSLPKTFPLRAAEGKTIQIPSVGYGTWASGETSWAKDAVLTALKAGYRHLDCAWMYGVDEAVGQAIKQSGIPREEIFVTSKVITLYQIPILHCSCTKQNSSGLTSVIQITWSSASTRSSRTWDSTT